MASLLRHSSRYFTADLGIKLLGLISMPLFTRILNTSDYGLASVFMSNVSVCSILFTLNASNGLARLYYDRSSDFKDVFTATLLLTTFLFILVSSGIYFFKESFFNLLGLPPSYFFIFITSALAVRLMNVFKQIKVASRDSRIYSRVLFWSSSSAIVFSLFLLYFFEGDQALNRLYGVIAAQVLFGVLALYLLREYLVLPKIIGWDRLWYVLSYSMARMPYVLSGLLLEFFDKIMLNRIEGSSSVAVYSVSYSVGALILAVSAPITLSFVPVFYEYVKENKLKEIDGLNIGVFRFTVLFAIIIILLEKEILYVLADKRYHASASIIKWVVLGYVFNSVATLYNKYLGWARKPIYLSIGALTAGIVNILMNSVMIPKYGHMGAGISTLISFILLSISSYLFASNISKDKVTSISLLIKSSSKEIMLLACCLSLGMIEGLLLENILRVVLFGVTFWLGVKLFISNKHLIV